MCFSWSSSRHVPWFTDEQQQQQQQTDSVFAHLRTERVFVELVHKTSTLHKHVGCAHTHTRSLTHARTQTQTHLNILSFVSPSHCAGTRREIQWPGCHGNHAECTSQLYRWLIVALMYLCVCVSVGSECALA